MWINQRLEKRKVSLSLRQLHDFLLWRRFLFRHLSCDNLTFFWLWCLYGFRGNHSSPWGSNFYLNLISRYNWVSGRKLLLLTFNLRWLALTLNIPTLFNQLGLVQNMPESSTFVMYKFAASLAHVLFTVLAVTIGIFYLAFWAQHTPLVLIYDLISKYIIYYLKMTNEFNRSLNKVISPLLNYFSNFPVLNQIFLDKCSTC